MAWDSATDMQGLTVSAAILQAQNNFKAIDGSSDTLDSLELANGVAITGILDEDDMVSDSAVSAATQQSVKKYVDDTVDTKKFGARVDKSSSYGAQQAATDGFVTARNAGGYTCNGYTDANANPTTEIFALGSASDPIAFTMPVKKSDYWKVTVNGGTPVVYWIPLG